MARPPGPRPRVRTTSRSVCSPWEVGGRRAAGKDAVECPVGQDARQAGEQCGVAGGTLSNVGHQQKRRPS